MVFPTEAYAEKEGTVTHPDGRLQRLRPAVGHPGQVRAEWQVLVDLGVLLGLDLEHHVSAAAILAEIAERSPLYPGITPDEIGGRGVRWQERDARSRRGEAIGALAFSDPASRPPRRSRATASCGSRRAPPVGIVGDRPFALARFLRRRARSWC